MMPVPAKTRRQIWHEHARLIALESLLFGLEARLLAISQLAKSMIEQMAELGARVPGAPLPDAASLCHASYDAMVQARIRLTTLIAHDDYVTGNAAEEAATDGNIRK